MNPRKKLRREQMAARLESALCTALEAGDDNCRLSLPGPTLSLADFLEPYLGTTQTLGNVIVEIPDGCTWEELDSRQQPITITFRNHPTISLKILRKLTTYRVLTLTEYGNRYELGLERIAGLIPFSITLERDWTPPQ